MQYHEMEHAICKCNSSKNAGNKYTLTLHFSIVLESNFAYERIQHVFEKRINKLTISKSYCHV